MAVAARLIAALTGLAVPSMAAAAERPDDAFNWQMDLQNPATVVMDYIHWFSSYTLIIVTLIVALVVALLLWCVVRFNERANPVPSRVTHNTSIEVLWTVLPVLILVAIAIPSFKLLYGEYDPSKLYPDYDPETTKWLTVKFTGVQWAWDVTYPQGEDNAGFGVTNPIDVYMLPVPTDQLAEGQKRNLSVDNPVIVPGQYLRPGAGDGGGRRDPLLRHAGLRREGGRGPRASQRDLLQRRPRRRLLRPVLGALRQGPRLHADRDPCRLGGQVPRVGGAGCDSDLPGAYKTLAAATDDDRNERLAAR